MTRFINSFSNSGTALDIIEDIDPDNVILVGHINTRGVLQNITTSGKAGWSKYYTIGDHPIRFIEGLSLDALDPFSQLMIDMIEAWRNNPEFTGTDESINQFLNDLQGGDKTGDILLLGEFVGSKDIDHLIMRVSKDGVPKWAKRIPAEQGLKNLSLVKVNKSFAFSGWNKSKSGSGNPQIYTITGNGSVLKSVQIDHGGDDEITHMLALGPSLYVVGGTSKREPSAGILSVLNENLEVQNSYILKTRSRKSSDKLHAVIVRLGEAPDNFTSTPDIGFYLVGTSALKSRTGTFIGAPKEITGQKSVSDGIIFHASGTHDIVISVCNSTEHLYILGQDRDQKIPPYVLKFTVDLDLVWRKTLDIEPGSRLNKIAVKNNTELWIAGAATAGPAGNVASILIKTDFDLRSCKSQDWPGLEINTTEITLTETETSTKFLKDVAHAVDPASHDYEVDTTLICPQEDVEQPPFEVDEGLWVQSPYLYLHAAGSPGHDASEGFLLRWFLMRNLGETHLPKGDLANSTIGFNKPDDFVTIYRAKYDETQTRSLDFKSQSPAVIDTPEMRWVYNIDGQFYYLDFKDTNKYANAETNHNPETHPYEFISAYGDGLLELEIRGNLAFSVGPGFDGNRFSKIFMETFSVQGDLPGEALDLSARKSFDNTENNRIVAENIRKIIWRASNTAVHILNFEFYNDFFNARINSGWEPVGRYALTDNTAEAALRLEDTSRFTVNGHWKKFQGDARVNVQNYMDRWFDPSNPSEGLRNGVETYITLSDTDPKAIKTHVEETDLSADPDAVNPSMDLSYLDLLQLASTDFHVARMLGLGTVNTSPTQHTDSFIYMAEYTTRAELDDGAPVRERQHIYLSLPTKISDERLPHAVETLPVTYGLELYPGTSEAISLTDEDGYLPHEAVRYVNIRVKPTDDFTPGTAFFMPPIEYSTADFTRPVFAGISYRRENDPDWAAPEISHLKPYLDAGSNPVFESLPVSFREDSNEPHYRHAETDPGIHAYKGYGINFYSRASDTGNIVKTNFTKFTKPNSLMAPHNVQVQLIQEEAPLILTARQEQDMLAAITHNDRTLVRVLFNYTHLHDINYKYGNTVDIFFREELPRNVVGAVSLVLDNPDEATAIISTTTFENRSNGTNDVPNIAPAHLSNFKGGTIVIDGVRYAIESVIQTAADGDNPQFVIRKNIDRNTLNPGSGQMVLAQSFISPDISIEDRFMAIENMANIENWQTGTPLNFNINLGEADWLPQTDSYKDDEGNLISRDIGGIWDTASIWELTDSSTPSPQIIPEYYVVEFDNKMLDHHPQYEDFNLHPNRNSVDWYKGIIRVDVENNLTGEKALKDLEIVRIENIGTTSTLRIIAHDPRFGSGTTVKTGSQIKVNCFPGYRVYLRKDIPHNFTDNTILPGFAEGSRKTLIGLSSRDTQTQDQQGDDYRSPIGIPQILYALEIVDPIPPQKPTGPLFATPPDFYGKSTYTFETTFRPETFAAVFYRADTSAMLKALYTPETYAEIISALPQLEEDEFYSDRIQHLLSFDYPDGTFSAFPNDTEAYRFPNPDNPQSGFNASGDQDPATIIDKIKEAVFANFLPLTEQPLLYSEIRDGNYIPSPKKQTVKSRDGKVLSPGTPEYDNAPMAKRHSGTNNIRFTDFTLDGEMSKNTSYCYAVREMGNRMALSEPSEILGPIRLVNKTAPAAPIIRKITSRLADRFTGESAAVDFQINEYPESANIKMLHILRATNTVDALTPRTMKTAKIIDIDLADINDGIITISDDFSDLDFLPYGDPIYYKIVALRDVKYQDMTGTEVTEFIPSKPSKTLLSNIVDIYNPDPPQITWVGTEIPFSNTNTTIKEINPLTLSWSKTTYKGTYSLMRQNQAGNWNTIFEISSNDEADLNYTLAETLKKYDVDDEIKLYHRFKVVVQNPSGLLNIRDQIITI